jgi:hypothetical protein
MVLAHCAVVSVVLVSSLTIGCGSAQSQNDSTVDGGALPDASSETRDARPRHDGGGVHQDAAVMADAGPGVSPADGGPADAAVLRDVEAHHAFKFHPGFYIALDSNTSLTAQLAQIDTLGADPSVAGFQHFTTWATLESPTTPGDYSGDWDASGTSGFTRIDAVLAKCAEYGKQLMLGVTSSAYGGAQSAFPSSLIPAYLSGSAYGTTSGTPATGMRMGGVWFTSETGLAGDYVATAIWWDAPVMARVTALATVFGARYDSKPNFEMFLGLGESSVPEQAGYDDAAALSQLTGATGYFPVVRAAWPSTLCRWAGNYTGTQASTEQFVQAAVASQFSIGGPDCANETGTHARSFWVDRAYRGLDIPVDAGTNPDYPDYLGRSGWVSEVQDPELGPNPAGTTLPAQIGSGVLSDILAHANLQGATHMIWWAENYTGPSTNRYPGESPNLLDFLHESALTNSIYPPLFP